jgi:hypothetical protein
MMTCRDFKAMTDLISRLTAQPAAAPQNITYASTSSPGGRNTRSPCGNGECCDAGHCLYPVEHGQPAAGLVDREKLANWFYDTNFDGLTIEQCTSCADALIASGLIRPMPTENELAKVILEAERAFPPLTPWGRAQHIITYLNGREG